MSSYLSHNLISLNVSCLFCGVIYFFLVPCLCFVQIVFTKIAYNFCPNMHNIHALLQCITCMMMHLLHCLICGPICCVCHFNSLHETTEA